MELFIELMTNFFSLNGLVITLIALAGIILLGILKYCKVFEKIENDTTRKMTYLICSVGLSLIGCLIYFLCRQAFEWGSYFALAGTIWALNQTAYNIFKTTKLNDLIRAVFDKIVEFIRTKFFTKEEETKEEE